MHEAKLRELQEEMEKSIIIAGDSNTLSVIDRKNRLKISKDIINLNSTINQLESFPQQQSTHFSHAHMEHLPK